MEKLFIYNCCEYEPTLICDCCGESFNSYVGVVAAYVLKTTDIEVLSLDEKSQITARGVCPEQHNVVHLHKTCVDAFDAKHGSQAWNPLTEHYSRMLRKLGLKIEPLKMSDKQTLTHQS